MDSVPRIIVVDDRRDFRDLAGSARKPLGYRVGLAETGAAGRTSSSST